MFRAVLFDLDGTLLDTLEDIATATNATLAARGLPGHPLAAFRELVGEGVELLLRRALPAPLGDDEATVAACVREMRASYGRDRTRAYPGIAELLDELVARGVALAVLSNKAEELVRPLVAELLGRWRFAAVRGARPGAPKKPDPAEALAIARALALAPDQVLYLGDSGIDMQTAVAAGMFPVGALWGFRAADELRAGGARALCARPEELLALLGSSWK